MTGAGEHEPLSALREEQVTAARRGLLEGLARLDVTLDQVLSTYLAAEERAQDLLYRDVLWRVGIEHKVVILNNLLTDDGVSEHYPFLLHLPEMVDARNVVAHMVLEIFESTDDLLVFVGRRRGDDKRRELASKRLEGLAALTSSVEGELWGLLTDVTERRGLATPEPGPAHRDSE